MLMYASDIFGLPLRATDGEIGSIEDFYFDDATWVIRYLVVDTGKWLSGRKVLIAPQAAGRPDVKAGAVPVRLTQDQVRNSPDIDTAKPISRAMEEELYRHYAWEPYWGEGVLPLNVPKRVAPTGRVVEDEVANPRADVAAAAAAREDVEPHLRSLKTVMNYYVHATNGDIGHVEDFLIDPDAWAIRYMVVDTRNWLPGRKVIVSPQWIERISWEEEKVYVDLTQDQVRSSPEYDPEQDVERTYEVRLFEYYGRAPYWE